MTANTLHPAGSFESNVSTTPLFKQDRSSSSPRRSIFGLLLVWRWEIGSTFVSLASMILALILLIRVNGLPLDEWALPIQPNSLIAVCTTTGKSAMMVSITSCIGQLKWRYFNQRARPLHHLQTFDEASRGPWGALVVLLSGLNASWIISGFALASVISLCIEPTAQQILRFNTREVRMSNVTAVVGKSTIYSPVSEGILMASTGRGAGEGAIDLKSISHTLLAATIGSQSQNDFSCPYPASRCTWPDYETLAVCSEFLPAGEVTQSCTLYDYPNSSRHPDDPKRLINCTFSYEGIPKQNDYGTPPQLNIWWNADNNPTGVPPLKLADVDGFRFYDLDLPSMTASVQLTRTGLRLAAIDFSNARFSPTNMSWTGLQAYTPKMSLCRQTIRNLTVTADQASSPIIESEELEFKMMSPMTNESSLLYKNRTGAIDYLGALTWRSWHGDTQYKINSETNSYLWDFAKSMLLFELDNTRGMEHAYGFANEYAIRTQSVQFEDLNRIVKSISKRITNHMNLVGGTNRKVESLTGKAYQNITHYAVRWPWILLPLIETAVVGGLMVLTIIITADKPLWKSSALATLFHGLDTTGPNNDVEAGGMMAPRQNSGLGPGEVARLVRVNTDMHGSDIKLEKEAAEFFVKLARNRANEIKFVVEGGSAKEGVVR